MTEEFIRLLTDNPDLPVFPMVDSEVVGDDYGYWMGSWGNARIDEFYIGNERIHFKDDDIEAILCDMKDCQYAHDDKGRDIYELSDNEWDELYSSIPWKKAIVVYIDTL